ncbi:hypothetical protein [Methylobacterium radiotolerans]
MRTQTSRVSTAAALMACICIRPMVELAMNSKKPINEGSISFDTTLLRKFISGTAEDDVVSSGPMKMKDGFFRNLYFGDGPRRRSARNA